MKAASSVIRLLHLQKFVTATTKAEELQYCIYSKWKQSKFKNIHHHLLKRNKIKQKQPSIPSNITILINLRWFSNFKDKLPREKD